jgi:hypothetical protein
VREHSGSGRCSQRDSRWGYMVAGVPVPPELGARMQPRNQAASALPARAPSGCPLHKSYRLAWSDPCGRSYGTTVLWRPRPSANTATTKRRNAITWALVHQRQIA